MKYIRTKDGITTKERFWLKNGGIGELIGTKEADTIEELCDYFAFPNTFERRRDETIRLEPFLFTSYLMARQCAKKGENIIGYIVVERKGVKTLEPVVRLNGGGIALL